MLEDDAGIEIVGEASDGDEAIRLARELAPDVIVMDCAMPRTTGLTATRQVLAANPAIAILMLSMHAEDTLVRQALDAGARGFILKSALDLDLAAAIRRVAAGERLLDPNLAEQQTLKGEQRDALSPRQLEVLQ